MIIQTFSYPGIVPEDHYNKKYSTLIQYINTCTLILSKYFFLTVSPNPRLNACLRYDTRFKSHKYKKPPLFYNRAKISRMWKSCPFPARPYSSPCTCQIMIHSRGILKILYSNHEKAITMVCCIDQRQIKAELL